jgi:hypothetical protein
MKDLEKYQLTYWKHEDENWTEEDITIEAVKDWDLGKVDVKENSKECVKKNVIKGAELGKIFDCE